MTGIYKMGLHVSTQAFAWLSCFTSIKCLARQARCALAVQLGHSSQLSLAGSSHSVQRTASFVASRASFASRSATAPSRDPLPAPALHAKHSCHAENADTSHIAWPAWQPEKTAWRPAQPWPSDNACPSLQHDARSTIAGEDDVGQAVFCLSIPCRSAH